MSRTDHSSVTPASVSRSRGILPSTAVTSAKLARISARVLSLTDVMSPSPERVAGVEPAPQPWRGRTLPLRHTRNGASLGEGHRVERDTSADPYPALPRCYLCGALRT